MAPPCRNGPAGGLLFYHIRQSTTELNRAINNINDLQGLRCGTLTVAVIESVARGLLPEVLALYWIRSPEITVDVRVTGSAEAATLPSRGGADLAPVFDICVPRNALRIASAAVPLRVTVAPGSRLTMHEGRLRAYDLTGERVLISDSSLSLGSSV